MAMAKAAPFVLSTRPVRLFLGSQSVKDGAKITPLPVQEIKSLSRIFAKLVVNVTFNQAASEASAPAYSTAGPYALFGTLRNTLTGNNPQIDGVSGHLLADLMAWKRRGARILFAAPLPAKNTSTSPVVSTETWSLFLELPVAVSEEDLTGLLLTAARGLVYTLGGTLGQASDALSLASGTTASYSGEIYWWGEYFELPANQKSWPDLTVMHQITQFPWPLTGAGQLQIDIPRDGTLIRLMFEVLKDGVNRDVQNALGLSAVSLVYDGSYHQFDDDLEVLQFINNLQHSTPATDQQYPYQVNVGGGGLYVYDLTTDAPRDYLDTETLRQPRLNLTFGTAPTQATSVNVLIERLVPLQ